MLKSRTILLVDDQPQFRGMLRHALVSRGTNIIDVESRDKALEVLRARTVDLILLDTNIPGRAGLEICRAIRTGWDVPIIVVSVCHSDRDKVEVLDGGADDFLSRPFSIEELMARMRAALRRAGFATGNLPQRALVRLPCGHYLTQEQILSLGATITGSRHAANCCEAKPGVGRPKKMVTCRRCGESGGTLEMRSHKCTVDSAGPMVA